MAIDSIPNESLSQKPDAIAFSLLNRVLEQVVLIAKEGVMIQEALDERIHAMAQELGESQHELGTAYANTARAEMARDAAIDRTKVKEHEARHDPLTGLLNRRGFFEDSEKAFADNSDKRFVLYFLDIDEFKDLNDTRGHDAGDSFLKKASAMLCKSLPNGLCMRLGGDEFAVLRRIDNDRPLEEILNHDENSLRQQFEVAIRTEELESKDQTLPTLNELGVGVSIGASGAYIPEEAGSDYDELLDVMFKEADARMYKDKDGKHSRVRHRGE